MQRTDDGGRAAIYARVSTEDQGDNNSIPDQLYICREYATANKLQVIHEYVDLESGLKGSRTQVDQLIAAAKEGLFSVVIVKKIDRLGRGPRAFYRIMDQLESAGVTVKFAAENYPEEVIPFLVAFGGLEVKMILERTASGRKAKVRAGKVNPPPCTLYGYDYDPEAQQFVINQEEAEWVRQIFAWHLERMGVGKITRRLNQLGVVTKKQRLMGEKLVHLADPEWCRKRKIADPEAEATKLRTALARMHGWNDFVITSMLKNTSYYGEGYVNRYKMERGKPVERPREEWIACPFPPIITKETFEASRRVTSEIRKYRELKRSDRQYMLRGLLYCAECQKYFVITYTPWHRVLADGTRKTYGQGTRGYRCRGMRYHPHLYSCRKPENVVAHRVEQAVWERVCKGLRNPALLLSALKLESNEAQDSATILQQEIKRIEQRLADLDLQTQRILRLYATGKWSETDLDLQRDVIAEERAALEEVLNEKQEQGKRHIDREELRRRVAAIAHTVEELPSAVQEMTPDQYQQAEEVIRLVVQRVSLDREGMLVIDMVIPEVWPGGDEDGNDEAAAGVAEREGTKSRCW